MPKFHFPEHSQRVRDRRDARAARESVGQRGKPKPEQLVHPDDVTGNTHRRKPRFGQILFGLAASSLRSGLRLSHHCGRLLAGNEGAPLGY